MARTYDLKMGDDRPRHTPQSGVISVSRDEDDNLNFHRVVGTEMAWTDIDERGKPFGRRTGIVRAIQRGVTLIECANGEWFEESPRGIHFLDDRLRCTHCGSHLCSCNPTHHQIVTMQTLTFEQLALLPHKTPIAAVEGTLISLTQPKNYASGANAGKPFQYGTIKSGNLEHGVKFDGGDATVQPMNRKGQFIRIEAHDGGKGLTGVYMDENEYPPGTIKRSIRCTATAVITYPQSVMGTNAPQTAPAASAPPTATQTPPTRQDAPQSSSVRNTGHSSDRRPVREKISDWLGVAREFCEQTGKSFEKFLDELNSADIREITTHQVLSYKEGYLNLPVVFDDEGVGQPMSHPSPTAAASLPSWKDFVNAKSGKKLGDYDDATFLKLAQWAYHPPKPITDREPQVLAANVRMGTVEKGLAKSVFLSLFAAHKGYGTEFDENDLETVAGEQLGKASNNLTPSEWGEWLDKFSEVIADCVTAHSNTDGPPF